MALDYQKGIRSVVCPLLAAIIWGSAFVAQDACAGILSPFAVNAIRSWIGTAFLLLLSFLLYKSNPIMGDKKRYFRVLLLGGFLSGTMLAVASNFQQAGIGDTDPGKAGFLTSLYVVLVPVFGLFCRRKAPATVWVSCGIALVGLYFLCITEAFTVAPSDMTILLCAVFFAIQILIIDRFAPHLNGIHYCCAQLFFSAIINTVLLFAFGFPTPQATAACWFPLVYLGVMSSGIAYTLQMVSQKNTNPAVVTLLLSLESVFAVLSAWAISGDRLSPREWVGCGLMFLAVTLANFEPKPKNA